MPRNGRELGTRTQRLTIEKPGQTAGDPTITWTTEDTVWAAMRFLSGVDQGGLVAEAAYEFRIAYRDDLDITPHKRLGLVGTDRKFKIIAAGDPSGQTVELVITAQEIV